MGNNIDCIVLLCNLNNEYSNRLFHLSLFSGMPLEWKTVSHKTALNEVKTLT